MVLKTLEQWKVLPKEIDCIASHGQTIYHAPQRHHQLKDAPNATLQLADADHIAHLTGIITLSDFRQKHVAAGGEGAPLALYGDYLLFSEASKDRILLNIGGIANFTLLPATKQTARPPVSTDVGPGNTLIDAAVQHYFPEQNFDTEGYIARRGTYHPFLLKELLQHPFFKQDIPKTTGQEMFPWAYVKQAQALSKSLHITTEDLLCTLTHFTVEGIYQHLSAYLTPQTEILVSGGGVHNTFLMELLQQKIASSTIKPLDTLGITADAKEAALFAVLANETICGSNVNITPMLPSIFMGKISLP
ncbi:MAG: anhydro-N-acetylmuramic acid kinase, partial [Bacteroidota bacterium]